MAANETHPTAPRGRVIWQDPPPQVAVPEGSSVALTVSAGPARIPIPGVAGYEVDLAMRMLESTGFQIVEARQVGQRSGWLKLQEAEGRRVGALVRLYWWLYDVLSPKKEYMVVRVTRAV